jgi:hypothetical protein
MTNKMKYPKQIYVSVFKENNGDEYLNAYKSAKEISEDGKIAMYELKEIKTKRTEIHLD